MHLLGGAELGAPGGVAEHRGLPLARGRGGAGGGVWGVGWGAPSDLAHVQFAL